MYLYVHANISFTICIDFSVIFWLQYLLNRKSGSKTEMKIYGLVRTDKPQHKKFKCGKWKDLQHPAIGFYVNPISRV